jgi:hypothetical protein
MEERKSPFNGVKGKKKTSSEIFFAGERKEENYWEKTCEAKKNDYPSQR